MKLLQRISTLGAHSVRCLAVAGWAALIAFPSFAAGADLAGERPEPFVIREEMVAMRDGVKLYTKIYVPSDQQEPLPFLVLRTPYGADDLEEEFDAYLASLAGEGYIFVFQDIRGKYGSEGSFVMLRPARPPGPGSGRRGDGHLRHHRLALKEHPRDQRPASECSASPTAAG